MAIEKVLITVKTYPTISVKYDELVCTAGFREDGTWIRIYPIQFRKKSYKDQYKKYEWIEIDLVKNTSDPRPESYRPHSEDTEIKKVGEILADGNTWKKRREIVLKNVYTDLSILIGEAKDRAVSTSLAVFKPTKIHKFIYEKVEDEWDSRKLEAMKQMNLFGSVKNDNFKVVKKLPYKFSYQWEDSNGKTTKMMIEDWEIGQLYWNCLKRHDGDKLKACKDVEKKYFDSFAKKKDIYLFLGTTKIHHYRASNPFVIIGVFPPNPITQGSLF
ncbi:hypothetical protein WAF17_08020 [Bernardetia sp. ABR2-2B]|uniref:hypothetical protein n=1 Tax=Bernardetia sp. ABR2-2B TaxID=3127472 RepID=UPI0030CDD158